MGWDAYAVDGDVYVESTSEFIKAAEEVKRTAGSVDHLLAHGGLDCLVCGEVLEAVTGGSVWVESWTPAQVRSLSDKADWSRVDKMLDKGKEERAWALESAKEFLRICAAFGYGVKFSW